MLTDLRLMIFNHVEIPPRLFCISDIYASAPDLVQGFNYTFIVSCSSYDTPALLHTNQESRQNALTIYKTLHKSSKHYVNLCRDILHFRYALSIEDFLKYIFDKTEIDSKLVTREALNVKLAHIVINNHLEYYAEHELKILTLFRGLKSVTLNKGFMSWGDEIQRSMMAQRNSWKKLWEGKVEPRVFFTTADEAGILRNGDITPLKEKLVQAKIEEVASEDELVAV